MKVLVTGASGFIGGALLKVMRRKGFEVIGTSRTPSEGIVPADVTNPSSFNELRERGPFDAVVHCAAIAHRTGNISDEAFHRVNVAGTKNIAEFAGTIGAKRFVHLSSVLVYGRHGVGIREVDECRPQDAYGASKLVSEEVAIETGRNLGMRVVVLRPAPVVGEGCKGNLRRLIKAIDRRYFLELGDGRARKSMIYVGDLADACVRVMEAKRLGGAATFNLAGETITTGELVEVLYKTLGRNGPRISLPVGPFKIVLSGLMKAARPQWLSSAARSLETWTSDDVYSTDSIGDQIGFSARVPIREAVRRTVDAYARTREEFID